MGEARPALRAMSRQRRAETIQRARDFRRQPTMCEAMLWERLRRRALTGVKFRRQHPLGPYVVDFYAPQPRLAVEIDGPKHDEPARVARDARRQRFLESQGVRFFRFTSDEVWEDLNACVRRLAQFIWSGEALRR